VWEPRFAALWAALVFGLCTLALAYPALTGQFLVNPRSDQLIAGYAFREFAASALRAGEGFPTWNPYLFGGMPYVAAMHGDIFYPTFLLRMVLPTDVAMTWGFIIHMFLAGMFTFMFLRAWGLGFFPSLIGGVAYMLSGQLTSFASPGHDGKLFVSTLLPLTLWLIVRGVRDGRNWAWGALAVVVGLAVLSPHPQLLQYMLLCAGAFGLVVALGGNDGRGALPRPVALRRLLLALGSVLLGGAIGAIQYLPLRSYVDWSPRAGGAGWEHAISYSMPIEEIVNMYLPQFSGILDQYWGRNAIHFHSEYLGAAVLVLGVAGFFAARRSTFRWFWLGTLVVSLLWSLGGNTPFYRLVYALVPGTSFFRAPSTMLYITTFSAAVLAALGAERALAREITSRYVYAWLAFAGAVALLASAGALTSMAQNIVTGFALPPEYIERFTAMAEANRGAVIAGAWRSFVFVALAAGLVWAASNERLPLKLIAWGLAVICAADLYTIGRLYWIFSPPARVLFASDPAIDLLKKSEPGRVYTDDSLAPGAVPRDVYYSYDGLMVHDIRVARGYHGNQLGRYDQVTGEGALESMYNPRLWRHENIRYLYTTVPDTLIGRLMQQIGASGQATKLLGPVRNSSGSVVYLYRLPGDNPPAWVAPIGVKVRDDEALATVLNPRFDPLSVAMLDTSAGFGAAQIQALPAPAGISAALSQYAPGKISLQLSAPAPEGAILVVSENYFPGWTATTDGRAAAVARANFNLIGVSLPTGARTIDLRFHDRAYETGKMVTLIALLAALGAALAGFLVDRRHGVGEEAIARG
jgi:hypothetical protein